MNLIEWFIDKSEHSNFKELDKQRNYPQPVLIQDDINSNNTDDKIDPSSENIYEGER